MEAREIFPDPVSLKKSDKFLNKVVGKKKKIYDSSQRTMLDCLAPPDFLTLNDLD